MAVFVTSVQVALGERRSGPTSQCGCFHTCVCFGLFFSCAHVFLYVLFVVQAAMSHAKSPMQMMAARQQLMSAKSRQVAERMEFNCFN